MKHCVEEELIAYQLREACDEAAIRDHLEFCPECAETSASIAETLRVFSAGPVPEPDLENAWQRLHVHLPRLTVEPRRWSLVQNRRWLWPIAGALVAAMLLIVFLSLRVYPGAKHKGGDLAGSRRGPLSAQPNDPALALHDPALALHLDRAERLLTEVSHTPDALDETTRGQAHELSLHNALYIREAKDRGDLGDAVVLEKLERVLTALDHEAPAKDGSWHFRFEVSTSGLLLDLRILRQNDSRQ